MIKTKLRRLAAGVLAAAAVALSFPLTASADTEVMMYGDVDEDMSITASDALLVLRSSAGMYDLTKVGFVMAVNKINADGGGESFKRVFGDIDLDENITASDALLILRASAGIDDGKGIGELETFSAVIYERPAVIVPTSIVLDRSKVTLDVGDSTTLVAKVSPTSANDTSVIWLSSNTRVASVNGGKITAKMAGTATITAKTSNGITTTCVVTVQDGVSKLIDHIKKEGRISSDGYKYVSNTLSDDRGTFTLDIVYNSSDETIEFRGDFRMLDGTDGYVKPTLIYDYKKGTVSDKEVTNVGGYIITCSASYNAKDIARGQKISYSVKNDPGLNAEQLSNLTDVPRDLTLMTAENYLLPNVRIGLGDIGFDNYTKMMQ